MENDYEGLYMRVTDLYNNAEIDTRQNLHVELRANIARIKTKADKELLAMKGLGLARQTLLAADNRLVETIFSVIKSYERSIFGATNRRIWTLTLSKISETASYLRSLDDFEKEKLIWTAMRSRDDQKNNLDARDGILERVFDENNDALYPVDFDLEVEEEILNENEAVSEDESEEEEKLDNEESEDNMSFDDTPLLPSRDH
ncbi:unnamed protein product [Oikopleura dioica]|uniref:Uncharacterized protein n=1 Tax=Oikopleura dioica TaxID=34765 RepID=E4X2C4_OIKDI|nr:unnamed protein product [Oikopleura dioica]